MCNINVIYLCY